MPAPANLVHETSISTGTGNLTTSAVNGKQRFSTPFGTAATTNVFDYFISNRDAAEYERGTGHMSAVGTLVRDTVIESTNANALVNFSVGTKDITNDVPAAKQYYIGGPVVLVADGGTGAATASAARTSLGLGTSAVLNAGSGASQVLQLDGAGLVPDADLPVRLGITADGSITDWNSVTSNGWYMSTTASNAPVAATWFLGYVQNHGAAGWCAQIVHAFATNTDSDSLTYRRQQRNGTWGAWTKVYSIAAELDTRYGVLAGANVWSAANRFTANVSIGADTAPSLPLIVSQNTAVGVAPWGAAAYQVGLIGADGAAAQFAVYAVGTGSGGAAFHFYSARGTAAAPLRIKSGDPIAAFGGRAPYAASDVAAGTFVTTSKVNTVYFAAEDWTATGQGCFQAWYVTPIGSTTRFEPMRLHPSGGFSIASAAPADPGAGVIYAETFFTSVGGYKRVSTQYDTGSNDTTLDNIPGLSVTLIGGKTYRFRAVLFTSAAAGGVRAGIGGTCTATAIIYQGINLESGVLITRATALGTTVAGAITAAAIITIEGMITVNAGGTLTVQFAQQVNNATVSSVLVGSHFTVDLVA